MDSATAWGGDSPEARSVELTTKGRYAVMAMADLASHADAGAVPLSLVAERQHLPLAYLEQLFAPLRRAGLVESARGRSGGYRLAKAGLRHFDRRRHGSRRGRDALHALLG